MADVGRGYDTIRRAWCEWPYFRMDFARLCAKRFFEQMGRLEVDTTSDGAM